MSRGRILVRGKLIVDSDYPPYFQRAERISDDGTVVYFNKNEKNGHLDEFEPEQFDAPEDSRRSWLKNKKIVLNIGHPAYKMHIDNELEREYLKEQMLKQYVYLYLSENQLSIFGESDSDSFDALDFDTKIDKINNTIELVYKKSLGDSK